MEPRRRSRRASRRHEFELPEWEEPEVAADNPRLKSTSQSIAEFPARGALATIEDPDKHKRQLSKPPTKPRKAHRNPSSAPASEDSQTASRYAKEEKLYIKLKSRLVPTGTETSHIRETPNGGDEDYRHDRSADAETELANGGKRLTHSGSSSPKRHRRAARPSFDAGLAELDPFDAEYADSTNKPVTAIKQEGVHKGRRSLASSERSPPRGRRTSKSVSPEPVSSPSASDSPPPPPPPPPSRPLAIKGKVKKSAATHDDDAANDIVNNDYCTACGGTGEFLCCETCPRSFHFSCIEAPVMDVDELPDEPWSCRHCAPRPYTDDDQFKIKKTLFGSLIIAFESQNAMAFQLPTHIRDMFSHIQTSKYGEYLDEPMKSEGVPQGPRIQDKNGNVLLCYKCQESSIRGKSLAVCSKCREPWHIDCVDPPLESTPLGYWVCPLHVENVADLPLRVRKPILSNVALKRQIANNGDIEITDDDDVDDTRVDATEFNGDFSDEEVVKHVNFPAQTRALPNGTIVPKGPKHRPRGFELDRVVYKLPSRAIKLDFLDAVHKLRSEPYRETPTSSVITALDALAEKPQPEREAVRNLMTLKLQGPAVNAAEAHRNLGMLVDAALNDADENEQVAAIRKLMKEKGRERLLEMLKNS